MTSIVMGTGISPQPSACISAIALRSTARWRSRLSSVTSPWISGAGMLSSSRSCASSAWARLAWPMPSVVSSRARRST
ncbi:MAG: hypothetical protein ACKOGH_07095 [Alphaproteobacteria bacterium]